MAHDHWFDDLSQTHTRPAVLKAAALAGVAMLVPWLRVPTAAATPTDPCFTPCMNAAGSAFSATKNGACKAIGTLHLVDMYAMALVPSLAFWLTSQGQPYADCLARAELAWHRDSLECRGSDCGDSSKYPGGVPKRPPQKCTPGEEFQCGDICCYVTTDCCSKNGQFSCYATGHNCGRS